MASTRAVGIDLGTTYSVAAWMDGTGRSAVIPNSEGDILTPSVVVFEDDAVMVGKEAKKLGVMKTERLAECVKRDMGNPYYSRAIDGEYLPPEVIQACVLKKLRQDVTTKIGPDFGVVITVPAFFDDSRRRATAIAGEIAGLQVLDILNEPVAGALVFGEHTGTLQAMTLGSEEIKLLVYDLGGGTFDVSAIEISPAGFRTLVTDGDVRLGGHDWDRRFVDLVCERFVKKYREDPRHNPVSLQRLWGEVERAKHTLSARQRAVVHIDHAGSSLETEVTREEFEEATADYLERTAHTTVELLAAAGLDWHDLSRILLVGGATRMPMVSQMLHKLSGITPDYVVSPDEAVARGAAIYAQWLLSSRQGSAPAFSITNVSSHNLGVRGVEVSSGQRVNAVLIPRNTPLPAKTTRAFVTNTDNQRSIAVLVLEGESSDPSECTVIGRAIIDNLQDLKAGHPVEVAYEYATNGRLHVSARVPGIERSVRIELERGSRLPDAGIADWQRVVCGEGGLDNFQQLLERQAKQGSQHWQRVGESHGEIGLEASDKERELQVAYDGVLVDSAKCEANGTIAQGPLQLDRTTETVTAAAANDQPGSAAPADSVSAAYQPRPASTKARTRRPKERTVVGELVSIVLGGAAALPLAVLIMWWVPDPPRDFLNVGPHVARWAPWIVPVEFRTPPRPNR